MSGTSVPYGDTWRVIEEGPVRTTRVNLALLDRLDEKRRQEEMTAIRKTVHTFKRGEGYFYDQIIDIQALGSGKWWEKYPLGEWSSDDVIITRDIKITVIVEGDEETGANA